MGKKTEKKGSDKDLKNKEEISQTDEVEAQELSAEEQLQNELTQALQEAKAQQEQYLRTLADMENLRKRTQKRKRRSGKICQRKHPA